MKTECHKSYLSYGYKKSLPKEEKLENLFFIFVIPGKPPRAVTLPGFTAGRSVEIKPTQTALCATLRLRR